MEKRLSIIIPWLEADCGKDGVYFANEKAINLNAVRYFLLVFCFLFYHYYYSFSSYNHIVDILVLIERCLLMRCFNVALIVYSVPVNLRMGFFASST